MQKSIKLGIIFAVIMLVGFLGYINYQKKLITKTYIEEIPINLTDDERKIYEDKLKQYEDMYLGADSDDIKYTALIQQGYQLSGLGKLKLAEQKYQDAANVRPDDDTAYVALSEVQIQMTNYVAARENIKKALDLDKTSSDIWRRYISLESNKFNATNEAINDLYVLALAATHGSIDIITVYAQFLESTGNLQSAKEYWQQASTINPSGSAIYNQEITRIEALLKESE